MNKKKSALSAAIWGTGSIAATHARVLNEMGVEIRLAVDIQQEAVQRFAGQFHIAKASVNAEEIFDSGVDCVHLCTPPNFHYQMLSQLLDAGFHVLCEKPLCFEGERAKELVTRARQGGRICAIDFNIRFHQAVQEARRLIEEKGFGPVRLVHGSYLQEYNAFPAPLDWRYDPALAGRMRAMTEIGSHWVDLAQFLTGQRITAVSAVFSNFAPRRSLRDGLMVPEEGAEGGETVEIASEDAALLHFRLESGAVASCVLCEASPGRTNRLSIEVTGEWRNLWWDSEENNALRIGAKGQGFNTRLYPFGGGFADTQRGLFEAFYEDVAQGQSGENPLYPTLEDGMRNVLICNAALESALGEGRWIEI
ncbi:MAG: Gfo/Idh/MocA family oxidoreductase [Oscillospiraceae bacterium]|jgi:predicted dehydrogenase|nr:Gfo/Idh/MocA family oxidoreductase [Oscillospiraceae bacterium]